MHVAVDHDGWEEAGDRGGGDEHPMKAREGVWRGLQLVIQGHTTLTILMTRYYRYDRQRDVSKQGRRDVGAV
jgi:hypothetical protein